MCVECSTHCLFDYIFMYSELKCYAFTGREVEEAGGASRFRRLESHRKLSARECLFVKDCIHDCFNLCVFTCVLCIQALGG